MGAWSAFLSSRQSCVSTPGVMSSVIQYPMFPVPLMRKLGTLLRKVERKRLPRGTRNFHLASIVPLGRFKWVLRLLFCCFFRSAIRMLMGSVTQYLISAISTMENFESIVRGFIASVHLEDKRNSSRRPIMLRKKILLGVKVTRARSMRSDPEVQREKIPGEEENILRRGN